MPYDVLVKGGEVIDPAQGIHGQFDVRIVNGKIGAIETDITASVAIKVIDAKGKIVTPGFIDLHTHLAEGIVEIGINPDEFGVQRGVTTMCDAGSLGYANFLAAKRYIIPRCKTDVFWFLNIANAGQAVLPEITSRYDINPEATLRVIEENRDIIKGVKFRAVGIIAQTVGVEAARMAKRIASEAGLPLMLHIGACFTDTPDTVGSVEPYTREVLSLLDKGDIITHVYSPKIGGVIKPDGSVLPEFKKAIERGVVLDVAHGRASFSIEIAKIGIAQGILPDTISTDTYKVDIPGPAISLATLMSKLLALGLTLDQVIEMTTINPARVLSEEQRIGSLTIGRRADITLMELVEKEVVFSDSTSDLKLEGKNILMPKLTLKSGVKGVEIIPATSSSVS